MKPAKQNTSHSEQLTGTRLVGRMVKKFTLISMTVAATCLPVTTWSALLDISNAPLFLRNAVQPNIFFMVDDSGSMSWEVLKSAAGEAAHSGYPNSGNIMLIPGTEAERLERCYSYNVLAFDPGYTYKPWKGKDSAGADYADMTNFTAVRNNPYSTTGTTDLTAAGVIAYFPWTDANANQQYDVGECGANVGTNNSDGVTFASLSAAQQKNFANWYSYYRKRDYVMKTALGEVVFTSKHRMGLGTLHRNGSFVGAPIKDVDNISQPVNPTANTNKLTLFDQMGKITPGSGTPLRTALRDVGAYYEGVSNSALFGSTYNHTDTFTPRSPILNQAKGGECQRNFAILMTDGFWNGTTSPGVGNVDGPKGPYYADTYSNTLADVAMYYYDRDLSGVLANKLQPKPTAKDQRTDQHMVTYTVAFGVMGQIPTDATVGDTTTGWPATGWPQPVANNNTTIDDVWHAAYNGRGEYLSASDPDGLIKSIKSAIADINASTSSAAGVSVTSGTVSTTTRIYQTKFESDSWAGHLQAYKFDAANNFVAADDFDSTSTNDAVYPIEKQVLSTGWMSGIGGRRTILTHNGTKGVPFKWPANATSPTADEISAAQVTAMVNGALTGLSTPDYNMGKHRLEYLRGRHDLEESNTAAISPVEKPYRVFRNRLRNDPLGCVPNVDCTKKPYVLGDTVHSSPLYVGPPPFAYPDFLEGAGNEYYKYRVLNYNRTPVIYFGANDGMLHGINADTGEEVLAYVPARLYSKLPGLTDPQYDHEYYVDESPAVGDVFYGGAWHTNLIGALRGGGQGIFALDVSDPSMFGEDPAKAASTVLWEFTDADDADLGFTFGRPSIAKMQDGKWYAIIGNGYNNTAADGNVSTTGHAVLYIIDIETKAVTKIDTGAGSVVTPNGLSRPAIVDYDGDYKVDYIYAGDLQGNMWKFDVTGTSPASWSNATKRSILFTAVDSFGAGQPITTEPEIDLAPAGPKGLFIIFGTGKYIETSDITNTQTQTMYGIWDSAGYSGAATVNVARSELVTQTLTYRVGITSGIELRIDTNNPITKWGNGGTPGEYMGWKIDLPESGERTIANPVIQDDKVIFISITPDPDPCAPGGSSWFMVFNLANGGRTAQDVIDVNSDGEISAADRDGQPDVVSGVRKQALILNNDISVMDDANVTSPGASVGLKCASAGSSKVITSDSKGNLGGQALSRPQDAFRQGWRQIQ